ncbi:beta-lactamase superfamily domain-containing protein [Bombardia bombarda]|uniref:Beta-lactamase superfamily domain-containing protein n=1 Tax=Bombardia bombarda TaxID=252184 RepID=A0AA39WH42_9PEZI|nr:beta-lactamase superfamily domain-containing protein [Bombardia bombarda]
MATAMLDMQVHPNKRDVNAAPLAHHKKPTPPWSWLPSSLAKDAKAGFCNPWPSWHKPTNEEVWNSLQWGDDDDPCIDLAVRHLPQDEGKTFVGGPVSQNLSQNLSWNRPNFDLESNPPSSNAARAARLLKIEQADLDFNPTSPSVGAKTTWLGHAGVLVQLPPPSTDRGVRPLRCLFDPIFSMRCSPNQFVGPLRSYPPPCAVEDLPPIDVVFISHNHYDHLDYDTISKIWMHNKATVRFFVPLGNKRTLASWDIPEDRIAELDWWESADMTPRGAFRKGSLKIWCTPAQHNSGRLGRDTEADATLWSSWYLENQTPNEPPYRVFFAGDTGYQFHGSPDWPPSPNNPSPNIEEKYPCCPAFEEIKVRLGAPHLLLLPVSVGATYAYLRSFNPLPESMNPIPRHRPGLTGAAHMPPWDAVRVLKVMAGKEGHVDEVSTSTRARPEDSDAKNRPDTVAIAIHWGTFVTDPVDVLKTLGEVEFACQQQGVRFARSSSCMKEDNGSKQGADRRLYFLALNHGQGVYT